MKYSIEDHVIIDDFGPCSGIIKAVKVIKHGYLYRVEYQRDKQVISDWFPERYITKTESPEAESPDSQAESEGMTVSPATDSTTQPLTEEIDSMSEIQGKAEQAKEWLIASLKDAYKLLVKADKVKDPYQQAIQLETLSEQLDVVAESYYSFATSV